MAAPGPYKSDILCFSDKLVIEVDGNTHAHTACYDAARTRLIEREGYRVLRFTNADVMQNLEGVIAQISLSLRAKEGAAKRRKGEGEDDENAMRVPRSLSPSHAASRRGPRPLPRGEEL